MWQTKLGVRFSLVVWLSSNRYGGNSRLCEKFWIFTNFDKLELYIFCKETGFEWTVKRGVNKSILIMVYIHCK